MPLLLIPVAAVGYKLWERRQKKKAEEERGEETGEPSPARMVDTLPSDNADKLHTRIVDSFRAYRNETASRFLPPA